MLQLTWLISSDVKISRPAIKSGTIMQVIMRCDGLEVSMNDMIFNSFVINIAQS